MVYFRLTGQSPLLQLKLENPIHLEDGVRYYLALTGFSCHNYFYNLTEPASISFYKPDGPNPFPTETFPPGFWDVKLMQKLIRRFLLDRTPALLSPADVDKFRIFLSGYGKLIIESPIKCHINNAMRKFLGFNELNENEIKYENKHSADKVVSMYEDDGILQIRPFDVLEIHCDLVEHSYINHSTHWHKHENSSLLYHLNPREYGDKIYKEPCVFNYIPLKNGLQSIRDINVYLTDENHVPLMSAFPNYIVYLKLVKEYEL